MKRTPLKRKTPMRRVSKKHAVKSAAYSKRVKEWKKENPWCKACPVIWRWIYGPYWPCKVHRTVDCHHMAGKEGKLLLDESWWLPVCRRCHEFIHEHSNQARELGLLAPKNL